MIRPGLRRVAPPGRIEPLQVHPQRNADHVLEAGFPELGFDGTNGLYGWRGMPESLKERIAADVRAIATDPAMAERLKPTGATMRPGNGAAFAAAIEEQRAKVASVVQADAAKPK